MKDIITQNLPARLRWVGVAALLLLTLQLGLNQPLQTAVAPQGMLNFQLATTAESAIPIVESWLRPGQGWAIVSLWSGFVFAIAYTSLLLMVASQLLKDRPGIRERKTGRLVRALFLTAGLAHVAENLVLLNNLDSPTDRLSLTATLLALFNYTALLLGIAGLIVIRAARRHPLQHSQA